MMVSALALSMAFMTPAGAQRPANGTIVPISSSSAPIRSAEDSVLDFTGKFANSNVVFDYTYVVEGGKVDVTGSGSIVLQGGCYYIEGDGMRIWCNGSSVWTMDVGANEVVIESPDNANGFAADPILILSDCGRLYSWEKTGMPATFADKSCFMFSLKAKDKAEFDSVKLYLSGDKLVGAVLNDGESTVTFTVSSFEFRPIDAKAVFVPESFSSDCIVTDLR